MQAHAQAPKPPPHPAPPHSLQIPLQSAVERELVRLLTRRPELGWEVEMAQYPHPAAQSPSMIGQFAPTFLFASIMFQVGLWGGGGGGGGGGDGSACVCGGGSACLHLCAVRIACVCMRVKGGGCNKGDCR